MSTEKQEQLFFYFMPALLTTLLTLENEKGSPLTKEEVHYARDTAIAMMVSRDRYERLEKARGVQDLDPKKVWEEWQEYKVYNG